MKVACLLITHLAMKAELRRRPQLRGQPVIVTQTHGSQQVVLDSSPEARGVTDGMPLQEALSRCKPAALLEADQPHYQTMFDEVVEALEQRSPLVEKGLENSPGNYSGKNPGKSPGKSASGCIYVGLDGLEAMYGGEARLVTSLLQAVPGDFNPRIGVAGGKFPAYVAAVTTGGGQATKVPKNAAEFLKEFSVDLLPLSWDDKARLHRFSLHTLGQLAGLKVGAIQAQLGPVGKRVWELAQGIDHAPLVPHRREELIQETLTFPSPVITQHAILAAVEILLSRAFLRQETRGKYVRGITIASHVLRHPPWLKELVFKEAIGSRDRAFLVIKNAFDSISLPGPLEDISLTLAGLSGQTGVQAGLFTDVRKREQLREMMLQLEAQLGCKPPIYQVKDIEPWSRTPERRQALVTYDP